MRDSKGTDITAVVIVVIATAAILFTLKPLPPTFNEDLHHEIGKAMAKETLALHKPGGQLIVITRDTAEFPQPASDYQFDAFKKVLERGKVEISMVQRIQQDPLKLVEVPPGDFYHLIRSAKPGTTIVSFMGPPLLRPEDRANLKEVTPKIVAFCPGNLAGRVDLPQLFQHNLLHAAVVDKKSGMEAVAADKTSFQHYYLALNRNNYQSMAKELMSGPVSN